MRASVKSLIFFVAIVLGLALVPVADNREAHAEGPQPDCTTQPGGANGVCVTIDADAGVGGYQDTGHIGANDGIDVAIIARNIPTGTAIAAFNLDVTYERAKLTASTPVQAAPMSSVECPVKLADAQPESPIGAARIACVPMTPSTAGGDIVLATIHFEAMGPGVIPAALSNVQLFNASADELLSCSPVWFESGAGCQNGWVFAPAGTKDLDFDGVGNASDNCPTTANAMQANHDADVNGDACDDDDDNDGLSDIAEDTIYHTSPILADTDSDGLSDSVEIARGFDPLLSDMDDDTVLDGSDNCPVTSNANQADADNDGVGNACDFDSDDDGLTDTDETSLYGTNPFVADTDGDGLTDYQEVARALNPLDPDMDDDIVLDATDNCPIVANSAQTDVDDDGVGDACDFDADNDGLSDADEVNLYGTNPLLADTDDDAIVDPVEVLGITNPVVADTDADGALDGFDNCPIAANPTQIDRDQDGAGDACDADAIGPPPSSAPLQLPCPIQPGASSYVCLTVDANAESPGC